MRPDTFKAWLEEKGCRFEEHAHGRGQGHASLVVRLGGKEAILPMSATHQDLDRDTLRQVVEGLGLDMDELPGGQDSESEKYRHGTTSRG